MQKKGIPASTNRGGAMGRERDGACDSEIPRFYMSSRGFEMKTAERGSERHVHSFDSHWRSGYSSVEALAEMKELQKAENSMKLPNQKQTNNYLENNVSQENIHIHITTHSKLKK